eukprot:COSAG02_NODE_2218_length_9474_cov_25.098453_3_plen_571_part_00
MLYGKSYTNHTPGQHVPSFAAQMESLARNGLNTVMVYGLGGFPPVELDQLMADFAVIGVRVMFQIVSEVEALLSNNNTQAWAHFTQMVARVQQSPALLGWYICDDCTGMLNRDKPNLSNWYTCAELSRMYESLRDLDPHHVTIGAVQSSDLWSFSDGTGALSIDVSMIENYDTSLADHANGHDQSLRRWPMDTSIIVNCVWEQGSWQMGPEKYWSARQINSVTWAGAITSGMYHNLYFGLFADTEEQVISSVLATSLQLHELAPAFLGSVVADPLPPSVRVTGIPMPSMPLQGSRQSGTVVARAWSEVPASGAAEPFCIFVAAVNSGTQPQFSNISLQGMAGFNLPSNVNATVPLQPVPVRELPVLGSGDERFLLDAIGSGETVVYQIGCTTTVATNCGLLNPSFEKFAIAGNPRGWGLRYSNDGRDGRATMLLDTRNAVHGRHALRVVNPSNQTLIVPFSAPFAGPFGFPLKAHLSYVVTFAARSVPAGMKLQMKSSYLPEDDIATSASGNTTTLTMSWHEITVTVQVGSACDGRGCDAGSLHLSATGIGELYLDHARISATNDSKPVC